MGYAYGLDKQLLLGNGAEKDGTRQSQTVIADTFEEYIGTLKVASWGREMGADYAQALKKFMRDLFSPQVFPDIAARLAAADAQMKDRDSRRAEQKRKAEEGEAGPATDYGADSIGSEQASKC